MPATLLTSITRCLRVDTASRVTLLCGLVVSCALASGCVRRTITITSDPAGALVWLNEREVGRTPVTVDFTYYGRYDVQLERDGYEPVMTSASARAPLWDLPGPDFFAELFPANLHSRTNWHFELNPADDSADALLERAVDLRGRVPGEASNEMHPTGSPETSSDDAEHVLDESTDPAAPAPPATPASGMSADDDALKGE